jgi:hypothetical protein
MFDIEKYKIAKTKWESLIKSSHNWDTNEGFISDGLVSPKDYNNSIVKIVYFLGESYGYDKSGVTHIETQLLNNIFGVGHPKRQTSNKIALLTWLITNTISNQKIFERKDINKLLTMRYFRKLDNINNALANIGWVNVKKASKHIKNWGNDATRQNYDEIYSHAKRNKDVIQMQIEILSPDILILCGDPVADSLLHMNLLGEGIHKIHRNTVCKNDKGQIIIKISHPGTIKGWGYDGIYEKYRMIIDTIQV